MTYIPKKGKKEKKLHIKILLIKFSSHLGAKNEIHEYVAAQHVHKHIKSYNKMFVSIFLHALKFYAPDVSSILLLNTLFIYVCHILVYICANKFFMKSLITNAIYHSVCVSVG